jgi:hypothetical protein
VAPDPVKWNDDEAREGCLVAVIVAIDDRAIDREVEPCIGAKRAVLDDCEDGQHPGARIRAEAAPEDQSERGHADHECGGKQRVPRGRAEPRTLCVTCHSGEEGTAVGGASERKAG